MGGYFGCSFCGEGTGVAGGRFTVAEAGWDRLKVMRWAPEQEEPGTLTACCSHHAQKLVGQWLVTGNLMSPFARAVLGERSSEETVSICPTGDREAICEFAVHRESVERLLAESPEFLETMLEALGEALGGPSCSDQQTSVEQAEMVGAMAAD